MQNQINITDDHKQRHPSPSGISLGLAPMEGVTDFPTRLWFRMAAAPDFVSTPFLRLTNTYPKTSPEVHFCPERFSNSLSHLSFSPTVVQYMSPQPDYISRVADHSLRKVNSLDINFGCPTSKVVDKTAGSGILRRLDILDNFLETLSTRFGAKYFSVKTRGGYSQLDEVYDISQVLKKYPLHHVSLHGRTREQSYSGRACWETINYLADSIDSPVWASGDIFSFHCFSEKFKNSPRIKTVLIGRGALRNPWVFEEIRNGEVQTTSIACLTLALQCYAGLLLLFYHDPDKLDSYLADGEISLSYCGRSFDLWQKRWEEIHSCMQKLHLRLDKNTDRTERRVLGRVKFFWAYIRSSLPEPFFEPRVLRSRTVADLIANINSLNMANKEYDEMPLQYNPSLNWIYGKGSKSN